MTLSTEQQVETLERVTSLATLFSTCVEAFRLIHASKSFERPQKLALAKLGIEHGRLLVFGDAVGISSPPSTIATHMIPSCPGALNPDPTEPVNFGVRDPRIDEPEIRQQVEAALNQITDRPASFTRDEMMERYGLKSPKRNAAFEPALCANRLEAFREKYGILKDLYGQEIRSRRGMSMAAQHWDIFDVQKFEVFVRLVRQQVDTLVSLLDVQDHIDRGMKSDIKSMGWHPDITAPLVRKDWEKLRLIAEACKDDYPQYIESSEIALAFLNQSYREAYRPYDPAPKNTTTKLVVSSQQSQPQTPTTPPKQKEKSKKSSWLKAFKFASAKDLKKAVDTPAAPAQPRSQSIDETRATTAHSAEHSFTHLDPERSKSLPGPIPEQITHTPQLEDNPEKSSNDHTRQDSVQTSPTTETNAAQPVIMSDVERVDTYNSMIDRHDKFPGIGRMETKDARDVAHGWHN